MQIGLRIAVPTRRGAREGVPRLLELLERHGARATFYFNFGPDRLRWWLPGRATAAPTAGALQAVVSAGHEAGLYGWDPARWSRCAGRNDRDWIDEALRRACEAFQHAAGEPPRSHAAPGWHTGRRALRMTQRHGFLFASDTRGSGPFVPVCEAEPVLCPQLPTTLPTLDEAAAEGGAAADAPQAVLAAAASARSMPQVFAARAEVEGAHLATAFEHLLAACRERQCAPVALGTLFDALDLRHLPRCTVAAGAGAGRAGTIAVQGAPFLAAAQAA